MTVLDLPQRAIIPAGEVLTVYTDGYLALRRTWAHWIGQLGSFLRGEHAFAQLIRFALVGGLSNIGYLLLFVALYGSGAQLANLAGSVVSTAMANELHRRLTFHASERVRWHTAQLEGGALALTGLAITAGAIALLEWTAPQLGGPAQAAAVLGITAGVGTLRFLTLRLWVF
ncbi:MULTISPECIES: GtrA family protein [Nocardia]|uniref:GtrA family protein n=1 Tax=Nocardia otitidiscaviarum TaxID=1823 RepID=A0A516NPT0_9NOCA|nr:MULTISPECIES: GtrA family protein [Nocardia]MBF6182652.1 GtrA family protein [Nocardia otitidiscaviarum]MCP9623799.1 GtrA family protein [Nocardia otitidiscaviarum]QDP80911.1 GtrA family protein [Nocardia otitidiscaviarum]